VVKKPQLEQPEPSAPLLQTAQIEELPICRLCWGDAEAGDPLLSPCSCSGSLKYIHQHCLADWQHTLRSQGQGRRAHICELCKTPYRLQQDGSSVQQATGRQLPRRLLAALSNSLFDAVYSTPWPSLAVQCWHGYVMAYGALQVGLLHCRSATAFQESSSSPRGSEHGTQSCQCGTAHAGRSPCHSMFAVIKAG